MSHTLNNYTSHTISILKITVLENNNLSFTVNYKYKNIYQLMEEIFVKGTRRTSFTDSK